MTATSGKLARFRGYFVDNYLTIDARSLGLGRIVGGGHQGLHALLLDRRLAREPRGPSRARCPTPSCA